MERIFQIKFVIAGQAFDDVYQHFARTEHASFHPPTVAKLCGSLAADCAFYVCAPPAAMNQTIRVLRRAGVSPGRIHFERFSL